MIVSASRRTDIPAFYSDWLFNRLREGFAYVRNPMNFHQVSEINLSPDIVDCIVFWTKNPKPMLNRLDELSDYHYYFQFTLNPYSSDVESDVPNKGKEVIKTFIELSEKIGADRVIWRYDPILLSDKYSIDYHIKYFEKLALDLKDSFSKCVISFIDIYKKNAKRCAKSGFSELETPQMYVIAEQIAEIAQKYNFPVASCAEGLDLKKFGIEHNSCIDKYLIEQLLGAKIIVQKDKNQREECGCAESIDIGSYDTCIHGCRYCYANYSMDNARLNHSLYDSNSPLLCSTLSFDDKITKRVVKSLVDRQIGL